MADNTTRKNAAGSSEGVAADRATYSGDADQIIALYRPVHVLGSEGSKTVSPLTSTIAPLAGSPCVQVRDAACPNFHHVTDASTNAESVHGFSTYLRSVHVFNDDAERICVKFHDSSVAPTPGTTAVAFTVVVQAGLSRDIVLPGHGISFGNGIGLSVTRNPADNDTTAVAAGSLIEVVYGG